MDKDEEFLLRLNETFRVEAREHLDALSRGLTEWESVPGEARERELIELLYRETHTLKGAARSVDRRDLEGLCHPLEGVFSDLKRGAVSWSAPLAEKLRKDIDALEDAVFERRSRALPEAALADTLRIAMSKLDPILLQAEELIPFQVSARERLAEWRSLVAQASGVTPEWKARASRVLETSEREYRTQTRLVEEHLDAAKELLVLPASVLTEGLPKLVRDLGADQGKDVELVIRGNELQMDKRLLEELKAPLTHLLRNAVGHGIEVPEVRKASNKRHKGTITLEFTLKDGRFWNIAVRDDGAGLDREALVKGAVDAGYLTPGASALLTADQVADLVFISGLSTKTLVDEVSGRGLGLAIVREKIARLGGSVSLNSRPGSGAEFRLQVPLTLSTLRGVLVRVGPEIYVVPSADVERVLRPSLSDGGRADQPTLRLGAAVLPRKSLASVLGVASSGDQGFAVVVSRGGQSAALLVDEVLEEQWVLVKPLGRPLLRVRNIAGATILGTGRVAAVLHAADLLEPSSLREEPQRALPAVLVAEDSPTTRERLRSYLEADYRVFLAADGLEAWASLQSRSIDVVVSDVDMPGMNGLALTVRIRREPGMEHLPVILVTSLDSPSDRENGMKAGADAYLTKGSFDRNTLLAAVGRLVGRPQ